MGIIQTIVLGRKDGIRARLRRRIFGGAQEDTSPSSSSSAPPASLSSSAGGTGFSGGGVMAGGSHKMEPPKDVTPPDGFEVVLHRDALTPGEVTEVIIGGTAIAIANVDGAYHAL